MTEPTERDREMARKCVARMHPLDSTLNTHPQIEHVALYLAAAREEGREECRKATEGRDDADRLGHIRRIYGWRPPEEWDETFLLHQLDKARASQRHPI